MHHDRAPPTGLFPPMPDLLLTHGYFLGEDPKEQKIMKPYPTLGLLYLSAYLKRAGFDVEVFDSTFAERALLERRLAAGPGVLGVYTNLITRASVLEILARARDRGWTVVVGGPESANYAGEYLARGADVVVIGEGEETTAELLPALATRGPHRLHGVLGTVFRDETGRVVENLPRPQIADLDSLPWPDRDAIDVQRYVDVWREHHCAGSVNLITARGCPYRCRWCSHAVFGYTHRRRSPADCADELESIVERYAPDQVWYADDVFTIHHRWLLEYAAELERRGLRVPFETISRADRMRGSPHRTHEEEAVIRTLAEMGCWRIWIGSESGSQRVLDAMQRDVTVEEVQWATRAARRHGIQVGMFLMWGYEGETLDDIAATVEHVKRSGPDTFLTTVSYPIKGTPYFDEVAGRVTLDGAWETSTDRDHGIRGRPPRAYYEHADRWLRSEVEAHAIQRDEPGRAAALLAEAARSQEAMRAFLGNGDAAPSEVEA
jgi:anaerobic magnesium-protoporphyrin IX monomethyl ester cyclase